MRHPLRCSLAALLGLFGSPAWAASQTPAADALPPLTLQAALRRAQAHSPDLAGFPLRQQAASARVAAAALRPAPELSASSENLGAGRDGGRLSETETTVALSQLLEPGDRRQRRIEAAQSSQPVLAFERTVAERDVAAEVGRRFVHLVADQQRLALAALAVQLAERTVAAARERVEAGRAPAVESAQAEIARSRAEIVHEHAEHELLSARRRLAAMWGAREPDFGPASAPLRQLPGAPDLQQALAALDSNPDLQRLAAEAGRRAAAVRLAEAQAGAPLTLQGGIKRREAPDDVSLVVGLSMPLFGSRRAAPGIAEARALHDQAPLEAAALRIALETRLFERIQELRHAITEARALRDDILPQMDQVLADTEQAWRQGRYSFLEWTRVQAQRLQLERDLIDATSEAHVHHIEIERLIGRALTPADTEEPTP